MAAPCAPDPQASKSSSVVQSLDVHGLLPPELLIGEEALHHLRLGLLGCPLPYLLQLLGQLLPVSLQRQPASRFSP